MVATLRPTRATTRIPASPHADALEATVRALRAGGLAALPTETVYGLAADAACESAVLAVYAAKGRPSSNPLIVHVPDMAAAKRITRPWSEAARRLAAAFWPGPLTLVLDAVPGTVAAPALAGGRTVAVRMPAADLMREAAAALGPLVAPSANRAGRVSATSAADVMAELAGAVDLVVDAGRSPIGVESTVVDVTGPPRLLRPGAVTPSAIERVLGTVLHEGAQGAALHEGAQGGPLRSPGLLTSHYAPKAPVRLDVAAHDVAPGEGYLAFASPPAPAALDTTVALSASGDLSEAARNLYAGLRALDASGVSAIAVSPIPAEGLGLAIRDRLARAAAPRPRPAEEPT